MLLLWAISAWKLLVRVSKWKRTEAISCVGQATWSGAKCVRVMPKPKHTFEGSVVLAGDRRYARVQTIMEECGAAAEVACVEAPEDGKILACTG